MTIMPETQLKSDALILSHMNLVYGIAKKYSAMHDEDLIQEGCVGIIKAAQSYDPSRGIKFSTYAYPWIKGHMLNEFSRRKKYSCVSLDKPVDDGNDSTLGDMLPDNICIEDYVVEQSYIESVYSELSEPNKEILSMLLNRKTHLEIAEAMKVKPVQISRRISEIKMRLRGVFV